MPGRPSDPERFDVIVVGARCAGAATAMLLAAQGRRVLVIDRASAGADTVSTHGLMRVGVTQLARWGLLDELVAAGTPALTRVLFRYGDRTEVAELGGDAALRAPRRTVLDPILVGAARRAGAEVRFGVRLIDVVTDRSSGRVTGIRARDRQGRVVEARAPLTIGADGSGSRVAEAVRAPVTHRAGHSSAFVYGYWSDVDAAGYEWCYGERCMAGLIPTNGGEVCVFVGVPADEYPARIGRGPDAARSFHEIFGAAAPSIAHRLDTGSRTSRFHVFPGLDGFLRRAHGPGWALVGDAGYFKDPITAHGISDALRDAQLLSDALVGDAGLDEYEATRDQLSIQFFQLTSQLASYDWTPRSVEPILWDVSLAMRAEQDEMAERARAASAGRSDTRAATGRR